MKLQNSLMIYARFLGTVITRVMRMEEADRITKVGYDDMTSSISHGARLSVIRRTILD